MTIDGFISLLTQEAVLFKDTMAVIDKYYDFKPTGFRNGLGNDVVDNTIGSNEGSAKVFAFGMLNNLTDEMVLACFGEHYKAVLDNPEGEAHANIRNFMQFGYNGIEFDDMPLTLKLDA